MFIPRLTPDVTADPGWEPDLARDVRARKFKGPFHTRPVAYGGPPHRPQIGAPRCEFPCGDLVSMLDQPELTPEWEAYLKTSYPTDIGLKRKGSLAQRREKNSPDQEGFALSTPLTHSPYGAPSLMPRPSTVPEPLRLPSP